MSFQSGIFHFDFQPIPDREAATIVDSVSGRPEFLSASWRQDGILMVHAGPSSTAQTPQPHVTDRAAVTFDGRIDNRDDSRTSDAELVLAAYQRSGCENFRGVIGDWSLAIWDRVRRRLVLASDFAGVRPLYYAISGSRIQWSTRLKPLACAAPADELDEEFVAGLLVRGGCPNRTPYPGVFSVPPGHYLVASADGVDIHPFWTPPVHDSIRYTNEADYEEHLLHLFREAVRCRLNTPSPAVSELSGGLDSSSIACMANRLMRKGEVRTPAFVTLTYDREGSRDKQFQAIIESFCGFKTVHLSTAEYAFLTESHTGDSSPTFWEELQLAIANAAGQQGAGTLITGLLGDLVMGNWHDDSVQVLHAFRTGRVPDAFRESLAWSQALGIPIYWVLGRAMMSAMPPSFSGPTLGASSGASNAWRRRDDSIAPKLRARMAAASMDRVSSNAWTQAPLERRKHFRGLLNALELRKLQPPEALEHLSYTHPYSHRPLVHYMLSVPANVVCGPGEPRRLMRRAFQELWPPELRRRRSKDSFGGVFLDSLRPLAASLLKSPKALEVVERGYVDPVSLTKRLERITHSLDCHEPQLRQIILLEFWLRGRSIRRQPQSGL